MTLSKGHDLILRHGGDAVKCLYLLLPGRAVDKGLHIHVGTGAVALQGVIVLQLQVVDDRRQEVVAKVAGLQFVYFFK